MVLVTEEYFDQNSCIIPSIMPITQVSVKNLYVSLRLCNGTTLHSSVRSGTTLLVVTPCEGAILGR